MSSLNIDLIEVVNSSISRTSSSRELDILNQTQPEATQSKSSIIRQHQRWLYNFLQRPVGICAYAYHFTVGIIIILGLLFFALSTVTELEERSALALKILKIMTLAITTVEYILMIWASSCVGRYRGWRGKVRFVLSPFRLINLLLIGIAAVIVWTCWFTKDEAHLKWLQCGMLFQVVRLENRFKAWRFLRLVFHYERTHMLASILLCLLTFVMLSYVMYFIEHTQPDTEFKNIPASMYYCIVTTLTIGYGDMAPTTTAGQIVGAFLSILGVTIWAVPPGILSKGMALRTYERKREKNNSKRPVPAACLIQCVWRLKTARRIAESQATYNTAPEIRRQHNAYVFVCKIKFDLARRRFKAAFKPYDIKDVMQKYSEGHAVVVDKVKGMQSNVHTVHFGLDGLLGTMVQMQCKQDERVDRLEQMILLIEQLMDKQNGGHGHLQGHLDEVPTWNVELPSPVE